MMIFFAIMIATGVIFGTGAVVVDAGYGLGQQAAMQNAADAGALAGAELMARNITSSPTGAVYQVGDAAVQAQALQFATANSTQTTPTIAVTYLNCATPPTATSPVAPNTSTAAICAVHVVSTVTYPALLARAIGVTTEVATASATAQIMPTAPPTVHGDVWPITHREQPGDDPSCFVPNPAPSCTTFFWGDKLAQIGSFKEAVDMSRYSALGVNPANTEQLFDPDMTTTPRRDLNCLLFPAPFNQTCYDNGYQGSHTKADVQYWTTNGWQGEISVPVDGDLKAPTDHRCDTYSTAASTCPNARLETNINGISAGDVRAGLTAAIMAGPIDPTCNCHSVTRTVIFWKYGEQNVNSNNIGSSWDDSVGDKSNSLVRVLVDKVRQFRFNEQGISSNNITGYFVGYYTPNGNSNGGTPNAIANTVKLVG
jgi:hypothetical protein